MRPLLDELQVIFRQVFDEDELVIGEGMTAADIAGWDSMGHINLIIAIEKHFEVRFTAAEIAAMRAAGGNVGKLAELLGRKTGRLAGGAQ